LDERGMNEADLANRAALDQRIARNIVAGQWTPSPQQRERIATALGVRVDEIRWGHATPVDHMYGHGPQFGRSP
jgi:ribosome-binding protein aMBF1 (putative translation factor)